MFYKYKTLLLLIIIKQLNILFLSLLHKIKGLIFWEFFLKRKTKAYLFLLGCAWSKNHFTYDLLDSDAPEKWHRFLHSDK